MKKHAVRRSVSLDQNSDIVIKRIWRELIGRNWRQATYSHALRVIVLSFFYQNIRMQAGNPHLPPSQESYRRFLHQVVRSVRTIIEDNEEITSAELQSFDKWLNDLGPIETLDTET